MNENILQNLLYQVNAINKKYEKIAEITGENFNIFNILGLTTNEVRTHSAFIAELLNPNGSHGQKDIFIKKFLNLQQDNFLKLAKETQETHKIFYEKLIDFKTENSLVFVEWYIGFKNENESEGGRIDILIKDKNNNAIIIENKIYAGDQPKQLVRYDNAFKDAPIFYLTLNKSKPSDDSIGELEEGKNFICISYKNDILEWLVECRKEAVSHSLLRETITQYINLIKLLTNQTVNDNMNEELIKLVSENAEFVDLAFLMSSTLDNVKQKLLNDFKKQLEEIADELKKENIDVSFEIKDEYFFNEGACFFFNPKSWSQFRIGFEFESKNGYDFAYGICRKDCENPIDIELINKIKLELKDFEKEHEDWPKYKYFENEFQGWANNPNVYVSIVNKTLKENIKKKVRDLIERLKDIEM